MGNVSYFDVDGLRSLQGFLTPIHAGMNTKHSLHVTHSQICINSIVLGKGLHQRCVCSGSRVFQAVCNVLFFLDVKQQSCLASLSHNCSHINCLIFKHCKNVNMQFFGENAVWTGYEILFTYRLKSSDPPSICKDFLVDVICNCQCNIIWNPRKDLALTAVFDSYAISKWNGCISKEKASYQIIA